MKIIKKILIGLLAVILLIAIVSLFLPKTIKVERSLTINAPHDLVYEQVNNFKNWQQWSYWDNIDPNMKSEYSGPERGAGSKHSWTSEHPDVQYGSMSITGNTKDSIHTELVFTDMPPSKGGWTIKDTTGGVIATVYMNMDMGFFFNVLPGLMMDGWLGKDFEKTLAGLKKRSEELAAMPAKPTQPEIKVEMTTTENMVFASYRMMTDNTRISKDIGMSYGKIGAFMKKAGLEMTGPVFAIYHSYSPEKIDIECGAPTSKMVKGEGEIKMTEWKAGNAVVAHYYGDYMGTGAAHELIEKYIKDNNKKRMGDPYEIYITDPMVEKDTMKWLTEVMYPVE